MQMGGMKDEGVTGKVKGMASKDVCCGKITGGKGAMKN